MSGVEGSVKSLPFTPIPTHCFKIEKSEAQKDCDLPTENENFLSLDSWAPRAQSWYAAPSSLGAPEDAGEVLAWALRGTGPPWGHPVCTTLQLRLPGECEGPNACPSNKSGRRHGALPEMLKEKHDLTSNPYLQSGLPFVQKVGRQYSPLLLVYLSERF